MIGCSYHCRACNGCFGSLTAFDAHRQFEEGHKNDWNHRICIEPMDDLRFAPKSEHGACKLARPPKLDTVVWVLRDSQEKYRQRLDAGAMPGREAA